MKASHSGQCPLGIIIWTGFACLECFLENHVATQAFPFLFGHQEAQSPTYSLEIVAVYDCMGASQVVLVTKNLPTNAGGARDVGSISGLGRSPGERSSNPLQLSCLEDLMDRGAWRATVHGVTKSRT